MPVNPQKRLLLLVDGHSLAFRSFYAFAKGGEGGLSTKDGTPTSVTYGFLKALLDNCRILSPQGVTIAFDTPEPTFRHKKDVNYKANRDVAPEIFFKDLEQLESILDRQLDLPIFKAPGYEADDILGTLANKASKEGWKVLILTGDRDLFQLVDDRKNIGVMYMGGGLYARNKGPTLIDEAGVIVKLGVPPKKVVDLKALTGDSSDNIPGIKGVGPKTAINLLTQNGDLDGVYAALDRLENEGDKVSNSIIKGALKVKLRDDKNNAYLSKYLAEILIEVPLDKNQRLELGQVDKNGLSKILNDLELNSLLNQLDAFEATFSSGGFLKNKDKTKKDFAPVAERLSDKLTIKKEKDLELLSNDLAPQQLPEIKPLIISNSSLLEKLFSKLINIKDSAFPVALDTETTSLNPFKAELVGIGVCWGEGLSDLAYIPIGHISQATYDEQLPLSDVINLLSPWLISKDHPKVLQNAKYDRLIFLRHGVELKGVFTDTLLADYLRDATAKHSLEAITEREFDFIPISYKDIVGKGETFANVDIVKASLYCGMDVYLTRKLAIKLRKDLDLMSPKLIDILDNIEQPLESVLAEMEATGIRIDSAYLKDLSKEISSNLIHIEEKVYKLAGTNFNLSSPKQLGDIIFNQLGLDRKKSRKTKTGWSTDVNVLERLENDHPLIPLLIEYRVLSKLLTTYVDALPQLIEEETARVHTDFNQAVTSTGRLSSSNPNLQNIPIRTDFSRRIRKAFLPKENWTLLSADYSQIELRILAHLSGEEALCDAFNDREDVHSLTAKILFEKKNVNKDERRLGKIINFGVIYGMGSQRLARSTGVSQTEAKEFLRRYKERYSKVFSFLELQERLALSKGYVETLLGRRRNFVFDRNGLGRLLGKNPYEIDLDIARRAGMDAQQLRAAANAPIQGSSADIIKLAMIDLHKKIKNQQLGANILLQVHDELVLEVDPSLSKDMTKIVKDTMENAVQLNVPLLVETGLGANWMEAK